MAVVYHQATEGAHSPCSPSSPPRERLATLSKWLLSGVRLQEDVVLEQTPSFTLVAATWRMENVAVKLPVQVIRSDGRSVSTDTVGDESFKKRSVKEVAAEAAFLSSLRHENIVRLYGVIEHASSGVPCLVLERLHESVEQRRRRGAAPLTFRDIVDVILDVVTALQYLHQAEPTVAHRDISSRNVLLTAAGKAKLGGLSSARVLFGKQSATKLPGADEYMPPETVLGDTPQYSVKIDIFSVGVLALEMGVNKAPEPRVRFVVRSLGGVALVPETKRRSEELAVLKELHPRLVATVVLCLQEEKRRPSSNDIMVSIGRLQATKEYQESKSSLHSEANSTSRKEGTKAPPKPKRNFPVSKTSLQQHLPQPQAGRASSEAVKMKRLSHHKYEDVMPLALSKDGVVKIQAHAPALDEGPSSAKSPTYSSIEGGDLALSPTYSILEVEREEVVDDGYHVPSDFVSRPRTESSAPDKRHIYQYVAPQEALSPPSSSDSALSSSPQPVLSFTNPTYETEVLPIAVGSNVVTPDASGGDEMLFAPLPPILPAFHSQVACQDRPAEVAMNLQFRDSTTSSASSNEYVTSPWKLRPPSLDFTLSSSDDGESGADEAGPLPHVPPPLPGEEGDSHRQHVGATRAASSSRARSRSDNGPAQPLLPPSERKSKQKSPSLPRANPPKPRMSQRCTSSPAIPVGQALANRPLPVEPVSPASPGGRALPSLSDISRPLPNGNASSHGKTDGSSSGRIAMAKSSIVRFPPLQPSTRDSGLHQNSPTAVKRDLEASHHVSRDSFTSWYYGKITREEAELLLKNQHVGCFLVRGGRTHSGYSITWRSSDPEKAIKNVIVDKPTPETFQVRSSSLIHGTMDDLLKFHKENSLTNKDFDVLTVGLSK